jgi:glucosamine--fructose-6-phosphate aminotransferase (isomerizing)
MDIDGRAIQRPVQDVTWTPAMTEKHGYKHFMQKEIFEQPRAVRDTLACRIALDSSLVRLDT